MEPRKCSKCNKFKEISEFYKSASSKSGYETQCKKCRRTYKKTWYEKNKDLKEKRKSSKLYYERNKEKVLKRHKTYREKNKSKIIKYQKEYNERYRKQNKRYFEEYYKEHKAEYAKRNKKCQRKMRETNIKFNITQRISMQIHYILKKSKNNISWRKFVNYNADILKNHLESTISNKYSWSNFLDGSLQIDHIIPVSAYKFESYEDIEFKKCWSLKNLRLIEAKKNRQKYNKVDWALIKKYNLFDILPKQLEEQRELK